MVQQIMNGNADAALVPVVLRKRIIVSADLIWEAERELCLPLQPFVGLVLYNTEWCAPGFDESEDHIEAIAYDLKTGRVLCYLPIDDFRPESSGSSWTEEEARSLYRDWTLTRQDRPRSSSTRAPA